VSRNDRDLPQNAEAEKSVLGAILLNPNVVDDVVDILGKRASDIFFVEAHQHLYAAILKLHAANLPVDTVALMDALGRRLDDAGGMSYIAGLTSAVPTSANVEYYARLVRDAAMQRRIIRACTQLANSCYNLRDEAIEDVIARGQAIFESIEAGTSTSTTYHVMDVVETIVDRVDGFLKGDQVTGIPLPWAWWNNHMGGLAYGEIAFLLARPNVGKTAMMLNIALHAASLGVPVLVLSLEMNKEKLVERLLNIDGGVDFKRIEKRWRPDDEVKKLMEAAVRVGNLNLWVNDEPTTTAMDVRAACRRFKRAHGPGLVLLDYAQKITTPGMDKQNVELAVAITALTKIPKETGHHLFVLGQLSREADTLTSGYDKWGKGAGTSQIEKDADMGFVLHAPKAKEKKSIAAMHNCDVAAIENCFQLTLAKNRNGPTGDGHVRFLKERQRFHEVLMNEPQGAPAPPGDPNEEIDESDMPF
jgi:replicative DNA helicase